MTKKSRASNGSWRLRADLLTTQGLLWVARARRGGELRPEVHLYLYDRYWRLAEHYERRCSGKRASRLRAKAEAHYRRSGNDGPPFAAALAMPVPRPSLFTWAVAKQPDRDPDDAA
jgi:hypothetical protein